MVETEFKIKLKSWKGDYLHRPDTPEGVTTWNTGIGNEWTIELGPNGNTFLNTYMLKSWKGDYLLRPDTPEGVTTGGPGAEAEWNFQPQVDGQVLKSWKEDFLIRPDTPQGVTTGTGDGAVWAVEPATEATEVAVEIIKKYRNTPVLDTNLNSTLAKFDDDSLALASRLKGVDDFHEDPIYDDPMGTFLSYAPDDYRSSFSAEFIQEANEILKPIIDEELTKLTCDLKNRKIEGLPTGVLKCWICQIGIWAAIVIIIGAIIAISQGSLIAPLLALQVGIIPVLVAITGIPEAIVATTCTIAGATFGTVIRGLCKAMRACS